MTDRRRVFDDCAPIARYERQDDRHRHGGHDRREQTAMTALARPRVVDNPQANSNA